MDTPTLAAEIAAWSLEIGDRTILEDGRVGTVESRTRDPRNLEDVRYIFLVVADDGERLRLEYARLGTVTLAEVSA